MTENTSSSVPEGADSGRFPFPSIVSDARPTLAPAEIARLLAVPKPHIQLLISRGLLKTKREHILAGNRITTESVKQFLLSRLAKPVGPNFSRPQDYAGLRWFHQEVALSRGEAWQYLDADAFPMVTFMPTMLQAPSSVALTPEQVEKLLGLPKDLLPSLQKGGQLAGLIDVRAGDLEEPMIRMPVETYRHWIKMMLTCGPTKAGQFLSDELRDSIYRELTQFLHAMRVDSTGHAAN